VSTNTIDDPAVTSGGIQRPERGHRQFRIGIGCIVAASMAAGLIVAAALVAAPFIPPSPDMITGVALLGFAIGWALLTVLSVRFSDHPQRWAAAPAVFLSVAGLIALLGADTPVGHVFRWVWPPVLVVIVVWGITRARAEMPGRVRRWLVYPVVAVLAIAAIGGGYQTVREALDSRAYPPPGQLVDVGGHRLHLHCTGSGSPTVILEPGGGASSSDMGWVAPTVAQHTRVCVYDRAGRGWSDPVDGPQDGAAIAADLHTLLQRAHVPGPYVLAGHSFGGLYVQIFAAQYPDQVAGLVLLDSTAPKPGPAQRTGTDPFHIVDRVAALAAASAQLGAGRLPNPFSYTTLPPRSRAEARATSSTAKHLASTIQEYAKASTAIQQASALTSLQGKPLIVVTADEENNDDQWQAKQNHMATLSTNSLHRHAQATHASLLADEADAAIANQAIRDLVDSVRSDQPLPSR
jgi:pimeloyl-ACP methyl ester carboxylesterase